MEHLRRRRTLRGRPTEVLRVTPQELPRFTVHVDAETAELVRLKLSVPVEEIGGSLPLTIELGDYRPVGPVRLPFRRVTKTPIVGDKVVQFERAAVGAAVTDADFRRRAPARTGR